MAYLTHNNRPNKASNAKGLTNTAINQESIIILSKFNYKTF